MRAPPAPPLFFFLSFWLVCFVRQDIVDLGVGVLSMETGGSEEATLARRGAAFLLGRLLRGTEDDLLQVKRML